MASQRIVLGAGLAILLVISAASIGLDVKSRSDTTWVDHTLAVLQKFSDVRLLIRRTESAERGFLLTDDPTFVKEYRESSQQIDLALAELIEKSKDNPVQMHLLESSRPLIAHRFAVSGEMVRLRAAGDTAAIAAITSKADGRAAMDEIGANLDKLTAEEQRLLAIRTADSRRTRSRSAGDQSRRRRVDPDARRYSDARGPAFQPETRNVAQRLEGRKRIA